jgi:DNA-binding transcriptional LysR family regulator
VTQPTEGDFSTGSGVHVMPRPLALSFELLRTFVTLIREDGDAGRAMRVLGINQPTMSKRLRPLQHAGALLDRPWLVRVGKVWRLTDEGLRVWPAVSELVRGYDSLEAFLDGEPAHPQAVRFACGQQMASGLVRSALRRFRREKPTVAIRVSTLRGRARIEGVSSGLLDLAIVTHDAPSIVEFARRPLYIQPLVTHHLALACATGSPWERKVRALPKGGVPAESLPSFPLILPEPDAGIRRELDKVLHQRGIQNTLDVAVEVGGWGTILAYVRDGFGVGLISEGALDEATGTGLVVRRLEPAVFAPIEAKLICRRRTGSSDALDLSEGALAWWWALERAAR